MSTAQAGRVAGVRAALSGAIARRAREWARRRTGLDAPPVELTRRRVYIVPTALGCTYALMLFAMLLAGLNYGNNLALILTFVLTATGWVAMHECHRNLLGLRIGFASPRAPHAGAPAVFPYDLSDPAGRARYDITVAISGADSVTVCVAPGSSAGALLGVPTRVRGRLRVTRVKVESRFPLGLCRAWSWLHVEQSCVVYPAPWGATPPPVGDGDAQAAAEANPRRGDDDWSGLREYQPGDALRRLAWKAYARGGVLLVKEMEQDAATPPYFDWAAVPGAHTEERVSRLARLVIDAAARGDAYGLKLPDAAVAPGRGPAHRHECLALLASFRPPAGEVNADAG